MGYPCFDIINLHKNYSNKARIPNMNLNQKIIKNKVGLLNFAEEPGNVSKALTFPRFSGRWVKLHDLHTLQDSESQEKNAFSRNYKSSQSTQKHLISPVFWSCLFRKIHVLHWESQKNFQRVRCPSSFRGDSCCIWFHKNPKASGRFRCNIGSLGQSEELVRVAQTPNPKPQTPNPKPQITEWIQ